MSQFADFGLPAKLITALEKMKITVPTPIQKESIPISMQGLDVLVSAQTGSGKTIAYLIPMILQVSKDHHNNALILAPTRELAMQIHAAVIQITSTTFPMRAALLIGGASMSKQNSDLRKNPKLIIGTPGRITDHLTRGSLKLNDTHFFIIDEADRMLDMGFGPQLDKIAEYLPKSRQTLMFSATLPPNIDKLAKKYLVQPKRIAIGSTILPAPKIKQEILNTKHSDKKSLLIDQLNQRQGSIIVFVKTKRRADSLSKELQQIGHKAGAMHGDMPQRKREKAILAFRQNKNRILVATDVAARGLDISHVMHVINYDLPQCPEDYIHRLGRTGRADSEGNAVSFISPEEKDLWRAIEKMMNPEQKTKLEPAFRKAPSSTEPLKNRARYRGDFKRFKTKASQKQSPWKRPRFNAHPKAKGFGSQKKSNQNTI